VSEECSSAGGDQYVKTRCFTLQAISDRYCRGSDTSVGSDHRYDVALDVLGLIVSSRYVVHLKDGRENCQIMDWSYEDVFIGTSYMWLYSTHIHHIDLSGSPGQVFSYDLNFLLSINTRVSDKQTSMFVTICSFV
jgi:hypothetical protein